MYVDQGIHSGRRVHFSTPKGNVLRRISKYAETVEGSGFTAEINVPWFRSLNVSEKISVLTRACDNAPHEQGGHFTDAICFALSLKLGDEDSVARLTHHHYETLAQILAMALHGSVQPYFRLWVSNPSYMRDCQSNNRAAWISRKLEVYEWCEVISLESTESPHWGRPWLIAERLLGRKSSGYWYMANAAVQLLEPMPGYWAYGQVAELARAEANAIEAQIAAWKPARFNDNCRDIVRYIRRKAMNSEGIQMGATDGKRFEARDVALAVGESAHKNLLAKVAGVLGVSTEDLTNRVGSVVSQINAAIGCGSNHWLTRNPRNARLGVITNPFVQAKRIIVVPHLASRTIRSRSLTQARRDFYEREVSEDLRNILGEIDSCEEDEGAITFYTISALVRSDQDVRVENALAPEVHVDLRMTSKFDRTVLGLLLVLNSMESYTEKSLMDLELAEDIRDVVLGSRRSMYRRRTADLLAVSEAVLRHAELRNLGLHGSPTGAQDTFEPEQSRQASRRRRNLEPALLILSSWVVGAIVILIAFLLRNQLGADPLSLTYAVIALNFVSVPLWIRSKYEPSMMISELVTGRVNYGRKGRVGKLYLDYWESVDCLRQISDDSDLAIASLVASDNVCYLRGSEEFNGSLVLEPIKIEDLPGVYRRVFDGTRLPVVNGPEGATLLSIAESATGRLHFKDHKLVGEVYGKWGAIEGSTAGV